MVKKITQQDIIYEKSINIINSNFSELNTWKQENIENLTEKTELENSDFFLVKLTSWKLVKVSKENFLNNFLFRVLDNSTEKTQRDGINFVGFTITDDEVNNKIIINVT